MESPHGFLAGNQEAIRLFMSTVFRNEFIVRNRLEREKGKICDF